ncbi:ATP cone domain-containing protein [Methanobacterium spitsbergense]|uniref:Transcriptional regulator n=1 Tax=Methanobacterium spitsbergense TaxID=2874285 RepID=A0A8T5UYV9_9EURY|nr:ATP cone domain-containing protein [Methanobacterium spitsbergense]MBZ2165993.1 transcriptional regulator [Methanobacterium spitsbergense]
MVVVVKKSGGNEAFDGEKIIKSIEKAAIDAGYSLDRIKNIIDETIKDITEEAGKSGEIDTDAIRDSIFNRFEKNESSIVKSWKNFDAKYKP